MHQKYSTIEEVKNIIKLYPKATNKENEKLLKKYKNGDESVRELLILKNVGLILFIIKLCSTL